MTPLLRALCLTGALATTHAPVAQPDTSAPAAPTASQTTDDPTPRGHLLIVGGGGTTDAMLARAIEIAGGKGQARVAVFPQASGVADTGAKSAAMWLEAGAGEAHVVDLAEPARARDIVMGATLVWFTGGDQSRLMQALGPTDLPALVRERHRAGALVGGTSAGAAVMSRVMITGDYREGLDGDEALGLVHPRTVLTIEGLGLMPGAIVDQHFVKRRRFNRLLATVIEHPDLVGIGIDERTAILVDAAGFEVIGESSVLVLDARAAELAPAREEDADAPLAASGMTLSLLRPGMKMQLSPAKAR